MSKLPENEVRTDLDRYRKRKDLQDWPTPSVPRLVCLAYQPPVSSNFLSEQTSHQQPASSTFLSEQTSRQPPAKRTGCQFMCRRGSTPITKEEPNTPTTGQSFVICSNLDGLI
jgi:hypothetical protein